jgi:hypothetical protein
MTFDPVATLTCWWSSNPVTSQESLSTEQSLLSGAVVLDYLTYEQRTPVKLYDQMIYTGE